MAAATVLMLDDASSDDSRAVIEQVAHQHGRDIRLLVNDKNSGSVMRQWARGTREASGELVVYQDGGQLRITRRSAYNRKIALLIESNPVGQSRPKIRKVPSAFKKKPRPRTEAELEGLRRGNARRAEEARLRRGKVSAAEGGDISSR